MKGLLLQEIALTSLFFQESIFFSCFSLKPISFWHLLYLRQQGMTNVNYTPDAHYGTHTLIKTDVVFVTPGSWWQDFVEKEFIGVGIWVQNRRLL